MPSLIFYFRKELLLIVLVALSLTTGFSDQKSGIHSEGIVWEHPYGKDVKGVSVSAFPKNEQLSELEIVPVKYERTPIQNSQQEIHEWGVSHRLDEYTWTMNVESDDTMASPSDIISALNRYRSMKGQGQLRVDEKLSSYAQKRADFFVTNNGMDSHAGFQDFVSHQDGFSSLGFFSLGENSSFGYRLNGTHLVEWIFAGDAPHDTNQLKAEWTDVGVGVSELAVDIVFGGRKQ